MTDTEDSEIILKPGQKWEMYNHEGRPTGKLYEIRTIEDETVRFVCGQYGSVNEFAKEKPGAYHFRFVSDVEPDVVQVGQKWETYNGGSVFLITAVEPDRISMCSGSYETWDKPSRFDGETYRLLQEPEPKEEKVLNVSSDSAYYEAFRVLYEFQNSDNPNKPDSAWFYREWVKLAEALK